MIFVCNMKILLLKQKKISNRFDIFFCFRNKIFCLKMLQAHEGDHGDTVKHFHTVATNFVYCCNRMKFVSVGAFTLYFFK